MAKKKKILSNPAQGFATTSVASKAKNEEVDADPKIGYKTSTADVKDVENQKHNHSDTPSQESGPDQSSYHTQGDTQQDLANLTPEAVESQLEETEIQLLVDKYAQLSSREASRYVGRMLAERKILRKQPQTNKIFLHHLLDDSTIETILDLARAELSESDAIKKQETGTTSKFNQQDGKSDPVLSLWILQKSLRLLHFEEIDIKNALEYAAKHLFVWSRDTGPVWGLEECIEWLALTLDGSSLPSFGKSFLKPSEVSDSDSELSTSSTFPIQDEHPTQVRLYEDQANPKTKLSENQEPLDHDSSSESDVQSDIEPENLVPTHLELRSRLYRLQPELADQGNKNKKSRRNVPEQDLPQTRKAKNLLDKLVKIETDPLFDKSAADEQWKLKRDQIAQEGAFRRTGNPDRTYVRNLISPDDTSIRPNETATISQSQREISQEAISSSAHDSEDDEGISALFQSEPIQGSPGAAFNETILIRDFGQSSGVAPRRILEEAVRSRDSKALVKYTEIGKAAFSHQHAVRIRWSKPVDLSFPIEIKGVISQTTSKTSTFEMQKVGAPDSRQSEGFASVAALFQVFSQSSKDGKVHLRLPPAWRDLWSELENQYHTESNLADQKDVRGLRDLVQHLRDEKGVEISNKSVTHIIDREKPEASRSKGPMPLNTKMDDLQEIEELRTNWLEMTQKGSFQQMLEFRKTLPIFDFKDVAMDTIEKSQVTIICGETGCGKSTQVPSFILEQSSMNNRPCNIYCTEPRRISAITLAQRVNQELGGSKQDLGTNRSLVGYAIRLETKVSATTRLTYLTTGILLRILESDRDLTDATHIIIDEVHERSIETDFLLIILRTLIKRRNDLKVVLMSATLNAERFSMYFGGAPILNVPGRTFPVQSMFLEDVLELTGYVLEENQEKTLNDIQVEDIDSEENDNHQDLSGEYSKLTKHTLASLDPYKIDYDLIIKLVSKLYTDSAYHSYAKAILIFLPGIGEIRQLSDMLSRVQLPVPFVVHALHSAIPSEDQQKAFDAPPDGYSKIVLSTNIAETGVTIPDVTCVIDAGKHREMRFDEKRQVSRLIESFISRANAKQRRGRAGRVQPGICFHLFTRSRHDKALPEEQTPEMLRLSLQDLVMRVKICKLGEIQATLASALDAPSAKNVHRAIDSLTEVGALTTTEELTSLGRQLSKLPLDPYLGKLVLNGATFKWLDMSLTVAAILTSKPVFITPFSGRQQALTARAGFAKGYSDLLSDFNAYASWRRICETKSVAESTYCRKNLLSIQALATVEDLKAQLLLNLSETEAVSLESSERLELLRISNSGTRKRRFVPIMDRYNANKENWELAGVIIAISFYPKILARDGQGWRNIATNQTVSMHPTSILRSPSVSLSTGMRFLSFYSILQTSMGAKRYNATSLSYASTLALALFAGEPSFNSVAQILSLDGSRIRFSIEADDSTQIWKEYVALKTLRKHLQQVLLLGNHSEYSRHKSHRADYTAWVQVWESILERFSSDVDKA